MLKILLTKAGRRFIIHINPLERLVIICAAIEAIDVAELAYKRKILSKKFVAIFRRKVT